MPYKLSPSTLSLMEECPRCFWLHHHKVWQRPAGIFPSLPYGMDRVLKNHFDKFMREGGMPPELCENSQCQNLQLFDNEELLHIWRNNRLGISWTDEGGNLLRGAIDDLLKDGEKLIVLDYKTRGYSPKEETAGYYQNQLDIYNFLLRKNGYQTEDYAFILFYFPKEVASTGEFIFDTELVKLEVSVENAESLWKKALELLDGECPECKCDWCERI